MRKGRWLIGISAVLVAIIAHSNISYANGCPPSWVLPARRVCKEIPGKKIKRCWCEKRRGFQRNDDVHVFGGEFNPLTTVDIYVTCNKSWAFGDPIGADQGDGIDTVQTDSRGNLPCVLIGAAPLAGGKFDIVVDANQDGTFNDCDTVYKQNGGAGFKVRPVDAACDEE